MAGCIWTLPPWQREGVPPASRRLALSKGGLTPYSKKIHCVYGLTRLNSPQGPLGPITAFALISSEQRRVAGGEGARLPSAAAHGMILATENHGDDVPRGRALFTKRGMCADSWADEIKRAWAEGSANTLALARVVRSARRSLQRGEWSRFWESGTMPFSRRKAQMLVVIAGGLEWVNAQTFAQMPHGWSILYCLAQLDQSELETLIAEGSVHPRLKLSEAKQIVARFRPGKRRTAGSGINITRRFERLEHFIAATLAEWLPQQRQWAAAKLEELALLLATQGPLQSHSALPRHGADIPLVRCEPARQPIYLP